MSVSQGKAVVVTGATSGIGTATAIRLHAEGAYVLVTGRDADRGRALAESLGERVRFRAADITDPDAADGVIDACVASFGAVDALVNNAALDHTDDLVSTPPESGQTERDVVSRIPLGRLAIPDDVAAAVVFLVSDDSRYVTGTTITVDGGYTAQ